MISKHELSPENMFQCRISCKYRYFWPLEICAGGAECTMHLLRSTSTCNRLLLLRLWPQIGGNCLLQWSSMAGFTVCLLFEVLCGCNFVYLCTGKDRVCALKCRQPHSQSAGFLEDSSIPGESDVLDVLFLASRHCLVLLFA